MSFRFRRSSRLGPPRFHFSRGVLSSISIGGRGASCNIPVKRRGGPRTTVGLPGTGLSWSVEHTPPRPATIPGGPAAGLPNSRQLRPGQLDAPNQSLLGVLRQALFAPGSTGVQLRDHGLLSCLLTDGSLSASTAGLLALIETLEAMKGYLLRTRGQVDANGAHSAASQLCRRWHVRPLDVGVSPGLASVRALRGSSPYPSAPVRTTHQAQDGVEEKEIPSHARDRVPRSD